MMGLTRCYKTAVFLHFIPYRIRWSSNNFFYSLPNTDLDSGCDQRCRRPSDDYNTHRRTKLTAPETNSHSRDMVAAHQNLNGWFASLNHAPFRDGLPSTG